MSIPETYKMQPSSPTKLSTSISSAAIVPVSDDWTTRRHQAECPPGQPRLEEQDFAQTSSECSQWKDIFVIITAAVICIVPIIGLIVSAFTAVPGSEPGTDGLASEESSTVRAFTMGWLFCLALKLRREYVGLVGSCSLLEPW